MRSLVLVLLAACSGNSGPHNTVADARVDDAVGSHDAPDAATHATAPVHTLYINADGVTLTLGVDDATQNSTELVQHTAILKPWLMIDAARATKIGDLAVELQTLVAPYDVTITTTRPTSGDYDMFVVTDSDGTAAGFSAGQGGLASLSCTASAKSIAIQFAPPYSALTDETRKHNFAAYALATFGISSGIPQTKVFGDCMCYSAQQCGQISAPCHIGGAGTAVDNSLCSGPGTMDEGAQFLAAFGPHA